MKSGAGRAGWWGLCLGVVLGGTATAWGTPDFVEHVAANPVYGEPAGVTMREPAVPRADEAVDLWVRIGYSFYWTDAVVYYTTDGSTPTGNKGVPSGSTAVAALAFVRNEPNSPSNIDWCKATLPAGTRVFGLTIKYRIGVWHDSGGPEIFANNSGCADGVCDDPAAPAATFSYSVKLAWPGKGAPYADHASGYPPVYNWKEEGVVGNNYLNVQIDQNGAVYDIYYPSAGCVQGMGTRNEGYVDGLDTFPPGLPPGNRGQMNLNQATGGIRVGGVTYWLTNENAAGYSAVAQEYVPDTNVISTSARLTAGGRNILVEQYDFCPLGISYPLDDGNTPNRGLYVKRCILTNSGPTAESMQFYFHSDYALNGGDGYDAMFTDAARGAMVAYDNTFRTAPASGEYNPTTFPSYDKDASIYLATALKLAPAVGAAGGVPATDFWSDSSTDQSQGWIGLSMTLAAGQSQEVDVIFVGGFDGFAGATGTYAYQMDNALDWFLAENMSAMQSATENHWRNWLAAGLTIDFPDDDYDELFKRSLLATALHLDGANGGVVAGMHNGAYPFVWPRDAVWAAITLDSTGHIAEAAEVYRFLRDVAYRANDVWGQAYWYQKYTTDGYIVWSAPQVDETSAVPWGAWYHYRVTGDVAFLNAYYAMIYQAGRASSEDSSIDLRLYYNDTFQLMYSNNLWEDAWDTFVYSNASVERGLRDAAAIAGVLGHGADAALFNGRAAAIHDGLVARLAWDGENTDISHLGLAYPFEVLHPEDAQVAHAVDRINGVATDGFGQNHPLMNFAGEWQDLVNRYWNDGYWHNSGGPNAHGSPWFLSTLWYGCYFAQRQDSNPGKGDIDNHKLRIDRLVDRLGPIGLGAEQIAPSNSLLFLGQGDFVLEAAWPNAWESMSFFVDALLLFAGFEPDAAGNTLRVAPKLPSAWTTMSFRNLALGSHRLDLTASESPTVNRHVFTNLTGASLGFETQVRVPVPTTVLAVAINGTPAAYTHDPVNGRVQVSGALLGGAGATTSVEVYFGRRGDGQGDGDIDLDDFQLFPPCLSGPGGSIVPACAVFDFEPDGDVDLHDYAGFQAAVGT